VAVDGRGFVVVDEHLRTTNPAVWAAGDLTGHPQFTHVAGVHASLAASNAVLGLRRSVDRAGVARVTYTAPEVAAVGRDTGGPARGDKILTLPHRDVDRAVAEADTDGFTRLRLDRRGRIVGATIVGPRAGETIGELALAVRSGLRARDLAALTHPYPTWNDGPWKAALADVREQLERPVAAWALRGAVRLRRRWVGRRGR
jgi:pyruvate/2-oxoglutarate dehydrogenase complex dihydrolipoamide dehydrogenase (E3) component